PRPPHRLRLRGVGRGVGLQRRDDRPRVVPVPDRAGIDVRQARARPRRHVPLDLPDLVLHLPRADQRVDADRRPADDRPPPAADLVRGVVDDDVLHRGGVDAERGYAAVRERVRAHAVRPYRRRRSVSRRSFFVGRPAPRSRKMAVTTSTFSCTGVSSTYIVRASSFAACVRGRTDTTTRRKRSPRYISITSPSRTVAAGLTRWPLIFTWPPLHISVASPRCF